MPQDGLPDEGLAADGRYVVMGNREDDLSDQIICGMDRNGDIINCAEVQPIEFLKEHWYERFDFDEALFANYGKDWWLGILYRPARMGLLGSVARRNMTESGDAIHEGFSLLWQNKRAAYLLLRQMARIALGLDEHEAEIGECLSSDPDELARFRELNQLIDHQFRNAVQTMGQRVAGGAFVGFSLRRVRIHRKYLTGTPAPVRWSVVGSEFAAKMTMNFILAGWHASHLYQHD